MTEAPFLSSIEPPRILSKNCFQFSAQVSTVAFNPSSSPLKLGIPLPPSLSSASLKRQAEFIAGRFAALSALKSAGYEGHAEIEIQKNHTPRWPIGFVGSITHTEGYVSAAIARQDQVLALGIDSENLMPLETAQKVMSRIAEPNEIKVLQKSGFPLEVAVTLIFSAKESLFKALFPYLGRSLSFQDSRVTSVDPTAGTLHLAYQNLPLSSHFENSGKIHTAIEITHGTF